MEPSAVEYHNMTLPDGEMVRMKRVWGGHRFTDAELERLASHETIRIDTDKYIGVAGELDWQEYAGVEYFGFAPWSAEAYDRENAPMPRMWNNHTFSAGEMDVLRAGESLLVVSQSMRTGGDYAVRVTFDMVPNIYTDDMMWTIVPHFDDFDRNPAMFDRTDCTFMPKFGGRLLDMDEVGRLRAGASIPYEGTSKHGRRYACRLTLELTGSPERWRLVPHFG